jgi:hypothetical protein
VRRWWLAAGAGVALTAALVAATTTVPTPAPTGATRWVAATTSGASPTPTLAPTPEATSASPTPGKPADCGPWGCEQRSRLDAAAALGAKAPGRLGIIVRDRTTGAVWRAGTADHVMWTSSTIKLAIATSLLERARTGEVTLDDTAHQQIAAMFHVSDNDAADALWKRYGKDALVPRFQRVYGMTGLTFVAGSPRYWGFMKASAEDLEHLMSYVLDKLDAADRDYIVDAMRHVGDIQRWGVWSAGPERQPGTKDGWSIESDPGGKHWCTSAVGFAGPGARYVVAVMDDLPAGAGTAGEGISAGVHAVSDVVATVFGAPIPAPVTVPDPSTGL